MPVRRWRAPVSLLLGSALLADSLLPMIEPHYASGLEALAALTIQLLKVVRVSRIEFVAGLLFAAYGVLALRRKSETR